MLYNTLWSMQHGSGNLVKSYRGDKQAFSHKEFLVTIAKLANDMCWMHSEVFVLMLWVNQHKNDNNNQH
jgi:hypothetical protein